MNRSKVLVRKRVRTVCRILRRNYAVGIQRGDREEQRRKAERRDAASTYFTWVLEGGGL